MEYFESTFKENDIYGVLSFIASKVLRRKPYTLASNIYSFSMIMWEFTSGIPSFDNRAHDLQLSLDIYRGECPEIIENTPQCYIDLMKKCWNKDLLKRPNASEISNIIHNWISNITNEDIKEKSRNIIMEFYKADDILENKQTNISYTPNIINSKSHPQAYHTSHVIYLILPES